MKEFKFRVWDGEKIISLNLAFDKWFVWIYRSSCSDWWVLEPYFPEVVIMQYTWLQDSYWKEIYQWDILKLTEYDWRCFYVKCIWWNIWQWLFSVIYDSSLIDAEDFSYYNDSTENKLSEIIGNIYENKWLLSKVDTATFDNF